MHGHGATYAAQGDEDITLEKLVMEQGWRYVRNTDSMFHVNKGNIGVRMDGVYDLRIEDATVRNVTNLGLLGGFRRSIYTGYFSK